MKKQPYHLPEVYQLLEPGPVVLVTTNRDQQKNIMTMSWHTMMEFQPPLIGCVISANNYSFDILRTTRECVINIPSVELIEQVVGCGNTSGKEIDKFNAFNFTTQTASKVKAPLIKECFANLECTIVDDSLVEKYNFFILEVLKAWIDPTQKHAKTLHHQGNGMFMIDGKAIQTNSKMK